MNIYVGNLDYAVKEQNIQELFEQFGSVGSVKIITDKFTGKSKGFAFVEMENDDEAASAIQSLNGTALKGRNLAVTEARPKEERPAGGGGGYQRREGGGGGSYGGGNRGGGGGGRY